MYSWSIKILLLVILIAPNVLSQGGKAEPKRITIAKGRSTATASGTLSNGQEMDHVFWAAAGQTVRLKVTSKPQGSLFDFRIIGDGFEFVTDHDRYSEYEFTARESGDYLVFVRKRPTVNVKRASFSLTLTVK